MKILLWITILAFTTVTAPAEEPKADLVLRHGRIYTIDAARSWAESIAVKDGRIVYVGDDQGLARWIGPDTKKMELNGKFVMPSFIDSHVHPVSAGISLSQCALHDATTKDEILKIVKAYAGSHSDLSWIIGDGWQLPVFPNANPQKEWLDAIVPDRPVFLYAADGHSAWVNTKALRIANITKNTPDPENGRIERNADGEPSGTLRESAAELVDKLIPPPTPAESLAGLKKAIEIMNGFGITGFHDASVSPEGSLNVYRQADQEGALTARVMGAIYANPLKGSDQIARFVQLRDEYHGKHFQATSVKIFEDGVIEANTAALLQPYLDKSDAGSLIWSPEKLNPFVQELDKQKFQIHFHAIGDRAIRVALTALELARKKNGARDARPRLAHIELIDPQDIARFAQIGAIPCFQPLWAYEDTYIKDLTVPKLGPARMRWIYPMRSVYESGATLAFGSDWNVSSVNPLDGIEVAVTRQDFEGPTASTPPLYPEERISLETALAAYTIGSAYANFWEKETGSLEVGKSADLIVLSQNPFEIPAPQINQTKVVWTLFEGKVIYQADTKELKD